jgi:hypothetical protein
MRDILPLDYHLKVVGYLRALITWQAMLAGALVPDGVIHAREFVTRQPLVFQVEVKREANNLTSENYMC